MASMSSVLYLRDIPDDLPPLPAGYLSRQRLLDTLRRSTERLCLICAPAGFGKSALSSEFLQGQTGVSVWINLSGQQPSLRGLVGRIMVGSGLGSWSEEPEQALSRLLMAEGKPIRIVLDDVPDELPPEVRAWLDSLLSMPSGTLQLIINCRQRPRWNLAGLKLRGELLELDHRDLAFERAELDALADLLLPGCDAVRKDDLWRQTAGWCAPARLLLGAEDGNGANWLREYLEHELLAPLSDDERGLLTHLAHLAKFSAELCAQLWEGQDGDQLFRRLLAREVFFLPMQQYPGWYCLRPVLANILLDQMPRAEVNRLRLQACRLLSVTGHLCDAIDLALSVGQPEVAVSYMGRLRNTWQTNEQHFSNFLGWCERLPAQLLESTPRLLYLCARALLFSGRLGEAETCLQRLGNFLPLPSAERNTRLLAHWQAMRGTLDVLHGNAASAQQHCRAALAQLGEGDWVAVLLCHTSLAHIAAVNGEPGRARQILQDGVELARRQQYLDCEVMLSIEKLRLMILQGGAERAQVLLRDEISRVEAGKRQHNPLLARLLFLQGELHLLNGELDASEEALLAGLAQADGCSAPFLLLGYLPLAEVAIRRGDCNLALLHVHQAERRMQLGNVDKACYESAIALQRMRILAAEGRWESVLAKGQELEAQGTTLRLSLSGMWSLQQRNQLLLAKTEHALGSFKQARRRLLTLLRQCQRYQFGLLVSEVRRLMLELGFGDMSAEATVEDFSDAPATLCEAEEEAADSSPCDPEELTSREISVLRLLAEGMSNQQVSDFLFISTNTVKSHARSIHAKLGATRRTQAILIAKSMGVLS